MADFNKVLLMGRLTRDPELRYTQSGTALAKFGMAVNRRFRRQNSQEMSEETCFVDIEAWGKSAETLNQYMRKGQPIFLEGRLRFDSWESKEGQKRSKLVVVVDNFQFLGQGAGASQGGDSPEAQRPPSGEPAPQQAPQQQAPQQAGRVNDGQNRVGDAQGEAYDFDDIPF